MTYEVYTQKDLMNKVKPRHTGGYRLDLQVDTVRKTFYSSKNGDSGRRDCARKALAWINGDNSKKAVLSQQMQYFKTFLETKKPSPAILTTCVITIKIISVL